jgi:AcrR family transcriptional regulator
MPKAGHPASNSSAARPEGLRDRKKRETRLLISNLATELFTERGFDAVTIDEVAAAANVSKVTVFNYFGRKEDLFFDRDEEIQALLRKALAERGRRGPLAALRTLLDDLLDEQSGFVKLNPRVARYWKTVRDSPALRARAREINDELERDLAAMLAASVDAPPRDATARLLAGMLLATWRVAFREALHTQRSKTAAAAREALVAVIDRGFVAARAAARGTPYA